jgi:hypothetical protein
MTSSAPIWHQHPVLFLSGLSAMTIIGLALMLADETVLKSFGFVLAALPSLLAGGGYLKHRL